MISPTKIRPRAALSPCQRGLKGGFRALRQGLSSGYKSLMPYAFWQTVSPLPREIETDKEDSA